MRLLLDQNISFRLIAKISHIIPETTQVRELGIENDTDIDIWYFAKQNNYTIVTFDADFFDISNLKGNPPKIIWIRSGNTTTPGLAQLLISKASVIESFLHDNSQKDIACLEIN
ncbi:DUF5615 family PIN-like protein [Flavobacterium rhizosphaerae]|uniref:DUF5615 family PIN-like protein n=1 Tax=Flavobacterium rhizosphaerae TaxID=3163298 RepID=A0ABW8YSK7_9FLAO